MLRDIRQLHKRYGGSLVEPYDPKKRYFGPQGSPLCRFIPESPIGIPQLQPVFNIAAYNHDAGYEGCRRSGWFSYILDAMERREIDRKFKRDIMEGITKYFIESRINDDEADTAEEYAELAYNAVRLGGWSFFRTDEKVV